MPPAVGPYSNDDDENAAVEDYMFILHAFMVRGSHFSRHLE